VKPRLTAAVLVLAALAASCARQDGGRTEREAVEGGVAIDTAVMAYLSLARAMHHEANLKEDADVPGAIAALDRLTAEKRPHPGERVPEIEEVLADTFARVAELHVRQGELAKASESVREGLTHAPAPSYFRGHLLEVAGITEEARARELGDAGKVEESAAAKARALDLLYQAVLVQERVVRDTLAADASSLEGGIP
jgi:hypothetical protein